MKFILLVIILIFAVSVAMTLVGKLSQNQHRLADLHKEMERNNAEMARHRREIERLTAAQEAQRQERDI